VKKRIRIVVLFVLLAFVSALRGFAQPVYPVTVVLEAGGHNLEAPDFQKFKSELEAGIKKLLVKDSIQVLKFNRDSTTARLADCNLLTCLYKISYTPGMMLNAKIECGFSFTDCHKKEIFTVSDSKMVGAVAGMSNYLKLFEKLVKPDLVKRIDGGH